MAKLLLFKSRRRVEEEASFVAEPPGPRARPGWRGRRCRPGIDQDPRHARALIAMAALWDEMDLLRELSDLLELPARRADTAVAARWWIAAAAIPARWWRSACSWHTRPPIAHSLARRRACLRSPPCAPLPLAPAVRDAARLRDGDRRAAHRSAARRIDHAAEHRDCASRSRTAHSSGTSGSWAARLILRCSTIRPGPLLLLRVDGKSARSAPPLTSG